MNEHRDEAQSDRAFGNQRWMEGHLLGVEDGRAEVRAAVEAALRLIEPDHITPMGARQVRAAMEKAEGER